MGHILRLKAGVHGPVDIEDMMRLSGRSTLRLPPEYAPFALILPTCIRATAHHVAQNANTRGLFRIPGSEKVIKSILGHYLGDDLYDPFVSWTVRACTLPTHIPYTIHDVASTFKRILSYLPGGILGSLPLFEVFVGIHSNLKGLSELSSTNRAKVRARLIALAIETIESQFRRHVICTVFGLLNMIGRITELSPKEYCDGRPVPANHQLMDYSGLGICFGPLLIREPGEGNTMKSATPTSGLLPFSLSPKRHRRQMLKMTREHKAGLPEVKNFMIAASVTEMLITYWRDVVYEISHLQTQARHGLASPSLDYSDMHLSVSDPYLTSILVDSNAFTAADSGDWVDRDGSPEPTTPTRALRRERSWQSSQASVKASSTLPTYSHLSPTLEEGSPEKACSSPDFFLTASVGANARPAAMSDRKTTPTFCSLTRSGAIRRRGSTRLTHSCSFQETSRLSAGNTSDGFTQSMSMGAIPPRVSSRHTIHFGVSAMTPTCEAESKNKNMANQQTPFVTVREEPVEEPIHQTVRSPLPVRLREKGRSFKNLLTCSAQRLSCSSQPVDSFVEPSRPLEHEAGMRRPCRPLPPLFSDEELAGDDDFTLAEREPRYLVDLAVNNPPLERDQGNYESRISRLLSRGNISK